MTRYSSWNRFAVRYIIPYSDCPENGIEALCYAFEEVFAEKVRALTERLRPRDLYDVVHLHRRADLQPDRRLVRSTLARKCEFKGIPVPTFNSLQNHPGHAELQAEWENMLAHRCPCSRLSINSGPNCRLPSRGWKKRPSKSPRRQSPFPSMRMPRGARRLWPAPGVTRCRWRQSGSQPPIGFALTWATTVLTARSNLTPCDGLKREICLYAVRHDNGQARSYRVDRIESATPTRTPFVPRYAIELTESGPLSVPDTADRSSASASAFGFRQSTEGNDSDPEQLQHERPYLCLR